MELIATAMFVTNGIFDGWCDTVIVIPRSLSIDVYSASTVSGQGIIRQRIYALGDDFSWRSPTKRVLLIVLGHDFYCGQRGKPTMRMKNCWFSFWSMSIKISCDLTNKWIASDKIFNSHRSTTNFYFFVRGSKQIEPNCNTPSGPNHSCSLGGVYIYIYIGVSMLDSSTIYLMKWDHVPQ